MSKQKQDYFKKILKSAIKQLGDEPDESDFYSFLPEDVWDAVGDYRSMDEYIAMNAIKYPELHPLMQKLVKKITKYNNRESPLWDQDEEQAGGAVARELALYDKANVIPYARFVSANDLNHEVYQSEDMDEILAKWGPCKETYAVAAARWLTPGQARYEFNYGKICKAMQKEGEAEAFIGMVAKWFHDEWFAPYTIENRREDVAELLNMVLGEPLRLSAAEIDAIIDTKIAVEPDDHDKAKGGGKSKTALNMQIQDRSTLESIAVMYNGNDAKMLVNYAFKKNRAFKFASPQELLDVIAELETQCQQQNYAYAVEKSPAMLDDIIAAYDLKPKPLIVPVLSFFTPKGQKTPLDKMNEEAFKGQKLIPCKKLHFYKGLFDCHVLVCDETGKRLMDATIYDGQFLWEFSTDAEMQSALADMTARYQAQGYELTAEDTLDYAFDYMITQMKQTAEVLRGNAE